MIGKAGNIPINAFPLVVPVSRAVSQARAGSGDRSSGRACIGRRHPSNRIVGHSENGRDGGWAGTILHSCRYVAFARANSQDRFCPIGHGADWENTLTSLEPVIPISVAIWGSPCGDRPQSCNPRKLAGVSHRNPSFPRSTQRAQTIPYSRKATGAIGHRRAP